jgi:hypothetical protein
MMDIEARMGCGLDAIPTNLNEEELNEWLTRVAEE